MSNEISISIHLHFFFSFGQNIMKWRVIRKKIYWRSPKCKAYRGNLNGTSWWVCIKPSSKGPVIGQLITQFPPIVQIQKWGCLLSEDPLFQEKWETQISVWQLLMLKVENYFSFFLNMGRPHLFGPLVKKILLKYLRNFYLSYFPSKNFLYRKKSQIFSTSHVLVIVLYETLLK